MIKITKTNPPNSFTEYKQKTNPNDEDYKPTFAGMDSDDKDELRKSLLDEQGWICAYCNQKISDTAKTKIEHHCEQSICNGNDGIDDRTLDYSNMLAVCLGKSGYEEYHCDTSKATFDKDTGLPISINPLNAHHVAGISYSSTGLIKSSNAIHNEEIGKILNLNSPRLKSLRSDKYFLLMKNAGNLKLAKNKKKLKKILENDLNMASGKFLNSFPGMSIYLQKYCD